MTKTVDPRPLALPLRPCRILLVALPLGTSLGAAPQQFAPRPISVGHSWDLGAVSTATEVLSPAPSEFAPVVGIGIAGSTDRVYVWTADGQVSSGVSTDFEHYSAKTPFTLPAGKQPWDIVTVAIEGTTDHVLAYYSDGTVSRGWSQDLGAYSAPVPYTLGRRRDPRMLVGIGSAGSDGHFYAWYSDGEVSEGTATDLDAYASPYAYATPPGLRPGHILDVAITGSTDLAVAWYHDVELGPAHADLHDVVDTLALDVLSRYQLPGLSVAISEGGRVVLEKGYGYANFTAGIQTLPWSRCRIGSCSKIITALSAMKLHEDHAGFSVADSLYGAQGALADPAYAARQDEGTTRHQPIVAKAISAADHTYTWYHNGTRSAGTSTNAELYSAHVPFTAAPGMSPAEIRAIAIDPNDKCWVWYDDRTFSAGTSWDLDSQVPRIPDVKVTLASGRSMDHVLGIAFDPTGTVFTWYDDGTVSRGSVTALAAYSSDQPYTVAPGTTRYSIRGIGIAKSNSHVYAWHANGGVTEGWSGNLDAYGGPTPYWTPLQGWDFAQYWGDWYADMRIDHLMSHTAGFTRSGDVYGSEQMFGISQDLMTYGQAHEYILATRKLRFEPGTSASYSNHGLGLLGHVVAEVSGMPYRDYVHAAILGPLGLDIRANSAGHAAGDMWPHSYQGGAPVAYLDVPTNDLGLAAGGWQSSAGDLVRLMLATDRDRLHPDILGSDSLLLMESRPYPGISSYAHGWNKDSNGKLAHNGRIGGGTAYLAKYPASYLAPGVPEITVAVCTNVMISDTRGGSAPMTRLANDLAAVTAEAPLAGNYDGY